MVDYFQIRIYFFGLTVVARLEDRLDLDIQEKSTSVHTVLYGNQEKKGHRKFNDDLWQKRSSVVT